MTEIRPHAARRAFVDAVAAHARPLAVQRVARVGRPGFRKGWLAGRRRAGPRGGCLAGLRPDAGRMALLAAGARFGPPAPGGRCGHGNPHAPTSDRATPTLTQGISAQPCLARAAPRDGPPPPVRAPRPPAITEPAA